MKKQKYIFLTILAVVAVLTAITAFEQNHSASSEKHLNIVLRNIGHQLLRHAGDSVSRVLPVKTINENTYQIEFQSHFTFVPDSLVKLVHENLKSGNLPTEYIVSVLNCYKNEIIFGYEVSAKTDNILPCLGRNQPEACYIIQIEFLKNNSFYLYSLLVFPILLGLYFLNSYFQNNKDLAKIEPNEPFIKVGNLYFYVQKQILKSETKSIELSDRENKLLKIFADNPNQLIERERCLREIWEDEGVIVVERSLDVLVSKLRKKISLDESIKIINVHGKGYKLTIG